MANMQQWAAGTVVSADDVRAFGIGKCFTVEPISDAVFSRMRGKSFPSNCTTPRESLRYIKALHYNLNGQIVLGEMVCNKDIRT